MGLSKDKNDFSFQLRNLQLLANLLNANNAEAWDTIPGNSKIISYYTGAVPEHPSATLDEIRTIEFREGSGVTLVFTQTFTYDVENRILTIVTT